MMTLHGLRSGITRGFQPISNAPKSVQSVLSRVQHRIHQQRLRILLRAAKDDPVDVQIGPQLYEDAPQVSTHRIPTHAHAWLMTYAVVTYLAEYLKAQHNITSAFESHPLPPCLEFAYREKNVTGFLSFSSTNAHRNFALGCGALLL
jgi:hypothetical protein